MRNDKERLLDAYLAAAARTGDRRALGRLVERWQPKLLGHAYRLTGEADLAADMAQEAWIEVMRGIARLDDTAAFPAWAMRIVTRRCARAIRSRQRRRAGNAAYAREPAPRAESPGRAEARADLAPLHRAMARLPGDQRAALGLFRGKLGWVMWLVGIVQVLLFFAALYALWHLFTAAELMNALRWGVGAVALVQLSTLLRGFMGMQFEANRVPREVKRLELRLVRMESRGEGGAA